MSRRRPTRAVASPPSATLPVRVNSRAPLHESNNISAASSSSSSRRADADTRGAIPAEAVTAAQIGEAMGPDTSVFPFANYSARNEKIPPTIERREFTAVEREKTTFNQLPDDARKACIGVVTRLLLFRSTKNESVTRTKVIETLKKLNPSYGSHVSVALQEAQKILLDTFGLLLMDGSQIPGASASDTGKYFVVNSLRTPHLMRLLSDAQDDAELSYRGVLVAVLHSVFGASGRRIDMPSLVKRLRQIDSHIPDTDVTGVARHVKRAQVMQDEESDDKEGEDDEEVVRGSSRSRGDRAAQRSQRAVEDEVSSGDDDEAETSNSRKRKKVSRGGDVKISQSYHILSESGDIDVKKAIDRMIKETYLTKSRVEGSNDTAAVANYTFGPRFFAEIGLTKLIYSYFDARGLEPSRSILKDIADEEARLRAAIAMQNDDSGRDGGEHKSNN